MHRLIKFRRLQNLHSRYSALTRPQRRLVELATPSRVTDILKTLRRFLQRFPERSRERKRGDTLALTEYTCHSWNPPRCALATVSSRAKRLDHYHYELSNQYPKIELNQPREGHVHGAGEVPEEFGGLPRAEAEQVPALLLCVQPR